ncbi:MAG TPA: hypothetical protein VF590_03950, partial [Isosphaeraceae bacterium]
DSLIDEWRFQLLPKIRERLPEKYEAATREREAESIFRTWKLDSRVRIRLVSGKLLLNHVVSRVKREHRQWCSPNRMLDRVQWLTPNWAAIAGAIFDGMVWPTSASGETGGLPTGASQAHRTVGRPEAG